MSQLGWGFDRTRSSSLGHPRGLSEVLSGVDRLVAELLLDTQKLEHHGEEEKGAMKGNGRDTRAQRQQRCG